MKIYASSQDYQTNYAFISLYPIVLYITAFTHFSLENFTETPALSVNSMKILTLALYSRKKSARKMHFSEKKF